MTEIWKDVAGFDGIYQISNYGNLRSFKFGILKPLKASKVKDGYFAIGLRKNGVCKKFQVHRLVAEAFIPNPNPDKYDIINHKDENPSNNRFDNLEWCDRYYNCHYGHAIEKRMKKIVQYSKDGSIIKEWDCIKDAEEETGVCHGSISSVCKGKRKSAGGFIWKYV